MESIEPETSSGLPLKVSDGKGGTATKTLTVGGTSATDVATNVASTFNGVLTDNHATNVLSILAVTKAGLGTLTLGGNYSQGPTSRLRIEASMASTRSWPSRPG